MTDPLALPWLLEPPADLRGRIKTIRQESRPNAAALRELACFALNLSQLGQIGKTLRKSTGSLSGTEGLRPVKLAIAASHTADFIAEAVPATALRYGLLTEIHQLDYGQAAQQLLDPHSELSEFAPDLVLLAIDEHALGLATARLSEDQGASAVDEAIDYIASLVSAGRENHGCEVIVQNLVGTGMAVFGNADRRFAGTPAAMIESFNLALSHRVAGSGVHLLDAASLARSVGEARWNDSLRWHDAKLPFALDAVPLYADNLCRLIAAVCGLSKKCLVFDLDNTLWGGVIGDDGVEGIVLGQGSAAGEAHLALQRYALSLRERGIVLAVCSKNEMDAAQLPFREHSEMILREDHFAVFIANWNDKASNLQEIARRLNIGTDALVFLDDNPAERERVRQELPMVGVPEIGDEPSEYVRLLSMAGYFEAVNFGEEDRGRADMYQANAERSSSMAKIGNIEEYLKSLDMVCEISMFDANGRARIAQLVNKSNQFNLTTKRYTETQIAEIEADPEKFAIQVRLSDRFGDNGMISVVIFDKRGDVWHCDTWLMSCRVLGRRVEEAVLAAVGEAARAEGASTLTGAFIPTAKNRVVERHFEKLGFVESGADSAGRTIWSLDLGSYDPPVLPMKISVDVTADAPLASREEEAR